MVTTDTALPDDSTLFVRHVGELSRCSGTLLGMADALKVGKQPDALTKRMAEMLCETSARIQATVDEMIAARREACRVADE